MKSARKLVMTFLVCSNDEITPIDNLMENKAQKIVIFDDIVCEKNQKPY